jgi:hypothetical protein
MTSKIQNTLLSEVAEASLATMREARNKAADIPQAKIVGLMGSRVISAVRTDIHERIYNKKYPAETANA